MNESRFDARYLFREPTHTVREHEKGRYESRFDARYMHLFTYFANQHCNIKSKSQMRGVGRCMWVYGVVCEGIFRFMLLFLLLLGDVGSTASD